MNIYFKYDSCEKSFSLFRTITTISKLNMERSVKLEIKLNLKISRRWFVFFKQRRVKFFYVVVLHRTTEKCTKNYKARCKLLFCSLNLLFSDVAVLLLWFSLASCHQFNLWFN